MSSPSAPAVVINHYAVGTLWNKVSCQGTIYNYTTCKTEVLNTEQGLGCADIKGLPSVICPIDMARGLDLSGYGYSAWYHFGLERKRVSNTSIGNIKWYCTYNGAKLKSPISVAVASALQNSVRVKDGAGAGTMQPLKEHKALVTDIFNAEDVRITNPLSVPGLAEPGAKGQFTNLVVLQAYNEGKYSSRPDPSKRVVGPKVIFVWSYDET